MITIKKNFYLASNYDVAKGQGAIDDLNKLLEPVGIGFKVAKVKTGMKLFIDVNEETLTSATTSRTGRPVEHEFDIKNVESLKAAGMTNKAIYEQLGMSKSLFYLKMREYKNNIGQCKGDKKL